MHKKPLPHNLQKGMTLLEMLVVLAIVSLLAMLGGAGYSMMTKRMVSQGQAEQFRTLIRDGATVAASRSVALTLSVASGKASLKNGNVVLRSADVDRITTGLSSTQNITFSVSGRVALPNSATALTMKVNNKNRVLQVSGIGQTRWQ